MQVMASVYATKLKDLRRVSARHRRDRLERGDGEDLDPGTVVRPLLVLGPDDGLATSLGDPHQSLAKHHVVEFCQWHVVPVARPDQIDNAQILGHLVDPLHVLEVDPGLPAQPIPVALLADHVRLTLQDELEVGVELRGAPCRCVVFRVPILLHQEDHAVHEVQHLPPVRPGG